MSEIKLLQSDLQCSTSRSIISWPDDDDFDTTFLLTITNSFSFESPSSLTPSAPCHTVSITAFHSLCKNKTWISLIFTPLTNSSNFDLVKVIESQLTDMRSISAEIYESLVMSGSKSSQTCYNTRDTREQFKCSLKRWLFECAYGRRRVW